MTTDPVVSSWALKVEKQKAYRELEGADESQYVVHLTSHLREKNGHFSIGCRCPTQHVLQHHPHTPGLNVGT